MNPLDTPVRLAELFEPGLLEDLCRSFVAQHGVGLRVYDQHVGALAEVVEDTALTRYVFDRAEPRRRFVAFVDELKTRRLEPQESEIKEEPTTGCRYLLMPVTWDQEVLGKVVCGPYLLPETHLPPELGEALFELPRASDAELERRLQFLLHAIDLVCHAGYRALLTSSLHLASISRAHEDLQRAHRELAETNARLAAQNERLRELDALKTDFLSTVSHELRTPLTSIIGYTEMLVEELAGPVTGEQRDYLNTILGRALDLLALIEEVLAFSRAEHGSRKHSVAAAVVRTADVVAEAVSAVRPQAMKGQVLLEVEVPPQLPSLTSDAAGLQQALINLLGNAVKFTDPGGVVRLNVVPSARAGQPVLRFSVTDTGIGMPADTLPRIFEPFYQVDNSSTRAYGGTGLGLAIVKRFVEGQGGTIDVESALGVGSTFRFDLPLAPARVSPAAEPDRTSRPTPSHGSTPSPRPGRTDIPAWAERVLNAEGDPGRGGHHRS